MEITRDTYDKIRSSPVGSAAPEKGGWLFSAGSDRPVSLFVYDKSADASGGTYSPDSVALNKTIAAYSDRGYFFAGIIHSHPKGFTSYSMGTSGSGYTASDEEAFRKLLYSLKGKRTLYFPIVQSASYGAFSMRIFRADKDAWGEITIREEPLRVVENRRSAREMEPVTNYIPVGGYRYSTAVMIGAGYGMELATTLARAGVSNFVVADGTRYEGSDIRDGAAYGRIGTYKADAVQSAILSVNPGANVKVVRQYVDGEVTKDKFYLWLSGVSVWRSAVIYCDSPYDDFVRTRELCSAAGIPLMRCVSRETGNRNTLLLTTEIYDFYVNRSAGPFVNTRYATFCPGFQSPRDVACPVLAESVVNFFDESGNSSKRREAAALPEPSAPEENKFAGLYSKEEIESKMAVVIGCGGSRAYVEDLARSGVVHFLLIDGDTYSRTNLQTQMSYSNELGKYKVDVIAGQVLRINPKAEVRVVRAMLDAKMSDERFIDCLGAEWATRPDDVLVAACTDDVVAQERASRLALKYGFPFIMAGIYEGGRVMEIVFDHPEASRVCPRCMLNARISKSLSSEARPAAASSAGTSVFVTGLLDSYKGVISLGLMLYHSRTADRRYSEFMDDNTLTDRNGRYRADRNFLFFTLDSKMEERSGRKAYATFDKLGSKLGDSYQMGISLYRKHRPLANCPDCGGTGRLLSEVRGRMRDTREGLYLGEGGNRS